MRFHRILAILTMTTAALAALVGTASANIVSDLRLKKNIETA
jgi:hypothetical protein